MRMKRYILLVTAISLSLIATAQKQNKRIFSTENPPLEGSEWISGEKVSFPDGDTPEGVLYTVENEGVKTYFAGRGACRTDDGKWVALYPASALRMWDYEYMYFTIPHEQIVGANNKPAFNRSDGVQFDFKPLTAYVSFTLAPDAPPVKEVRISTNKFLSGSYKVQLEAKSLSVLLDTGERFRDVVLKPQPEVGIIPPGDHSISLYARVYPEGYVVEVIAEDGRVAARKISSEVRFALGQNRDLGVITAAHFAAPSNSSLIGTALDDAGVVFWTDPEDGSKGKAVAAVGSVMNWGEQNSLYGIHTAKENYENVHSTVTSLPEYQANPENFKAVKACEDMRNTYGGNWHVPSVTEMKYLFNAYYGKTDAALPEAGTQYTDEESLAAAARFDSVLESLGGEGLLANSSTYWLCAQNSNGNVQYVRMSTFGHENSKQMVGRYVRCVRDFDLNVVEDYEYEPKTDVGQTLAGDQCQQIAEVVSDTTYKVTDGLDYYKMTVITAENQKLDMYLLRADLSKGVALRAAVAGESTPSKWKRQIPSEMAAHMDSPSHPVYALVNADFCENREPIRPRGPIHSDGKIWIDSYSLDPRLPQQALSYLGVTYDGNVVIAPSSEYQDAKKSLKECSGGGVILIQNHEIQGGYVDTPGRDPRTAVGYTSDNVVWILAVDGRHKGVEGMTYIEMASIFKALGCEAAVNLDGGGSTQMLVRNPQTDKIEMQNWPSDPHNGFGGRERGRLNGWVIIKK